LNSDVKFVTANENRPYGTHGFDIIFFGNESLKLNEIANEVGKLVKIPHRCRKEQIGSYDMRPINRSAILFFSSWDDYRLNIYHSLLRTGYQSNLYFLVYVDDEANKEFLDEHCITVKVMPRFFLDYFIEANQTSIALSTFVQFQKHDCEKCTRTKVNEFSIATHKWENKKFEIEKFANLNQCKLQINVMYSQSLAIHISFDGNVSEIQGYATKFNDIVSHKLNFRFTFNLVEMILRPNVSTGLIHYQVGKLKHAYLSYRVNSLRKQSRYENQYYNIETKPFSQVDEIILISRFKPYTIVEKIFLPFQTDVWWWLIGTLLVIALVVLAILMFASKIVQKFVFGLRVKTPLLNMM
jgi:hypothetical protein